VAIFSGTIRTETLHGNTWLQVVLPDATRAADAPVRVAYVLHGTTGHSADWVHLTRLPLYAQEHGVAFVLPEIGNTWARNIPDRGRFFDYLVDELPEIMAGMFRVSRRPEDVAIMGNSAGAFAALKCALSRPAQYGFCAGFSTASVHLDVYLDELRAQPPESMANPHLRSVYGPDLRYTDDDVLLALARRAAAGPVHPRIYLTIGSQDFLAGPNRQFFSELDELGLDVTHDEWEGGHDWVFWDESLRRALTRWPAIG
jgi:S-formylglutathione hydrolase FrmB